MVSLNPRELQTQARACVENSRNNTRSLMLIYTVTLVVLSLAANGLNLFLNSRIDGTGGLAGLGTRTILQTIQEVLTFCYSFFSPFWQAGFLYAVICNTRREQVDHRNLFFGFRRFMRILGYTMAQIAVIFLMAILVTQITSNIFVMTPFAQPFIDLLTPLMENGTLIDANGAIDLSILPLDAVLQAAYPMLILWALVFIPIYIFVGYSFRMALYLLLQGPQISGIGALAASWRLMRGHRLEIFRLDLRYWWYYALGIATVVVGYLDSILPMLGITLPMDPTVAYFVCLLIYGLLTIGLNLWKKWEVDTAYVLAYEAIVHPE